jgi:hypothetical protein
MSITHPTHTKPYAQEASLFEFQLQGYPLQLQGYPLQLQGYPLQLQGYPSLSG